MNKKFAIIFSSIALLTLASCGTKVETNDNNQINNTAIEGKLEKETKAAPAAYDDFSTAPFSYRQYNGQDLANIGKQTVLYFSQASCGTCQKTDADIKAQKSLPDGVSILKVDFDTETELNKKYNVTTKHTFVLIDENGNEIAKEIGLNTTKDIASFVANGGSGNSSEENIEISSDGPNGYTVYKGQDLANLGEETVLYFFQESCGTCQKTDADIKAQSSLPNNIKIIKVDFDNDTEINKKYNVTTKHTFVLVDENGNEIAKEIGLNTTKEIAEFAMKNSSQKSAGNIAEQTNLASSSDTKNVTESIVEKTNTVKTVVEEVTETPVLAASYKNYTGATGKESVLFFSAAWCPSCVAADKNLKAESDLSINTDIYKVDYDSNKALRDKYGVTSQHTFVRIDANGNLIKKMVGGSKSSDLQGLFN